MQHLSSELKKIKKDNFGKILRHQSEKIEKLVKKKEEEPPQQHICFDEISKEKDINSNINQFSQYLSDIFTSIKTLTNDYCIKLNQIIEKLNNTNKKNKNESQIILNMENYIYKTLKECTDIISKNFAKVECQKDEKDENLDKTEQNIDQLEEYLQLDINKMEFNRAAYLQEFNNFEISIIKEELDQKENYDNDDDNEKKKRIMIKEDDINNDNVSRILALQKSYFDISKKLRDEFKQILDMMHIKRKFILKTIYNKFQLFLSCINDTGEKINKITNDENTNNIFEDNEENSEKMDENINDIFKEDLYKFKFLSEFKTIKESKNEIKNKRNNFEYLYDKLDENNIENIAKKLKKYDIQFSKENTEQFNVLQNNKIIKSKINLIINAPLKFIPKERENFISLIKSSVQNQILFLQYLNNYRATGNLNLKELTINIFCEIFLHILMSSKDFKSIQLCIILSQTYYYEKDKPADNEGEGNKIFMINYMKKWQIFKNKVFWKNYLDGLIDDEIKKINESKEKKISTKQMTTSVYSSIFTMTKNMVDFGLDMDFIINLTNEAFLKYNISDNLKKDIINYLIEELQAPIQK
jgi:hypothetical protein